MLAYWALVAAILILAAAIIADAVSLTRYSHEELSEDEIARRLAPVVAAELIVSRAEHKMHDEEDE